MAVSYLVGSLEYHQENLAQITDADYPWSFAIWFKPSAANSQQIWSCADSTSSTQYYRFGITSTGYAHFGGSSVAFPANAYAVNAWNHGCATEAANNDRTIWQDGDDANKGTNATTLVRSSPNRSGIGVLLRSAQGFYFNGALAHLVLWKGRGLDAVDAEALAKGAHPYTRAHGSLAHYYKLRGNGPAGTVVRDSVGGIHMNDVVGGTPTKAEEEPLIRNCFLQGCG